jgi:alginate O-acetyltransferase complex protein AlgI
LVKKAVIADGIASVPVTMAANLAATTRFGFGDSWLNALIYTLQLYFDFSGYSDMAIGLARIFGMRLPLNFNSPLKAANFIEFWQRWHMTLTHFLTDYVYNPMVLRSTRARITAGRSVLGKSVDARAFTALVGVPTLVTMALCGLWHGAGYQYIVWGLMLGFYLIVNHLWHLLIRRLRWNAENLWFYRPLAVGLTFACLVLSLALFKADDLRSGLVFIGTMLGVRGFQLPLVYSKQKIIELVFLLAVVWFMPNSQQLLRSSMMRGRDGQPESYYRIEPWTGGVEWQPSLPWAAAFGAFAVWSFFALSHPTRFMYFAY